MNPFYRIQGKTQILENRTPKKWPKRDLGNRSKIVQKSDQKSSKSDPLADPKGTLRNPYRIVFDLFCEKWSCQTKKRQKKGQFPKQHKPENRQKRQKMAHLPCFGHFPEKSTFFGQIVKKCRFFRSINRHLSKRPVFYTVESTLLNLLPKRPYHSHFFSEKTTLFGEKPHFSKNTTFAVFRAFRKRTLFDHPKGRQNQTQKGHPNLAKNRTLFSSKTGHPNIGFWATRVRKTIVRSQKGQLKSTLKKGTQKGIQIGPKRDLKKDTQIDPLK